jgi:hypothetical protein
MFNQRKEPVEKELLKDFGCNGQETDGPVRGWGERGLPGLRDEDDLGDFPLSWKVTVEQHSIEELGEILKAKGGQLFERPACDEVVTRGFISRKVSNYCLYLGSVEAGDGVQVGKGFLEVL